MNNKQQQNKITLVNWRINSKPLISGHTIIQQQNNSTTQVEKAQNSEIERWDIPLKWMMELKRLEKESDFHKKKLKQWSRSIWVSHTEKIQWTIVNYFNWEENQGQDNMNVMRRGWTQVETVKNLQGGKTSPKEQSK